MEGMVEGCEKEMNKNFWRNKKVMLTGHTGFKGTWMCLLLEQLGARICGYSLPLEKNMFYNDVHPVVEQSVEADISDLQTVQAVMNDFEPDILFHFAAHSSLQGSKEIPEYILKTNMVGTLNVLEASRKSSTIRAIVIVTSDKCYFNYKKNEPYREESLLWATDPYSASKVCQELVTACYRDTFFLDKKVAVATARASNAIGPGDYNFTRLFPYIFNCFLNGMIPEIRNPHAIRPWQYVLDILYGYLLLAEKLYQNIDKSELFNGAYNFGPTSDAFIDVEHVTQIVSKCFSDAPYKIVRGKDHIAQEAKVLMLDSSKAQEILNWYPKYTTKEAIEETAGFMKDAARGMDKSKLARMMVEKYLLT